MIKYLENKVCIITGGANGIGLEAANEFLRNGSKVSLLDLDKTKLDSVIKKMDPEQENVIGFSIDVTNEDQIQVAVKKTFDFFGSIDILVNSAGIIKHFPIEKMSLSDFESVIKVNLTGTFLVCKAVIPFMKKNQKGGKIVNISSLGGRTGRPNVGVNYAASKAGVIGLTRTLAREVGKDGIYVNAIAPGPILTDLTRKTPKEIFDRWNEGRAINRYGSPSDIAKAILFLASERSDWITGITLDVNGGIFIP